MVLQLLTLNWFHTLFCCFRCFQLKFSLSVSDLLIPPGIKGLNMLMSTGLPLIIFIKSSIIDQWCNPKARLCTPVRVCSKRLREPKIPLCSSSFSAMFFSRQLGTCAFFISNGFFQISLSVASLFYKFELQMCCLIQMSLIIVRHFLYFLYLCFIYYIYYI